jgi:spermidine/putrescine-binding protein
VAELASVLASGRAWVSTIGWESAPFLPQAKGSHLRIIHPAPGDYSFCDNLCIAAQAPNAELAHALINHYLAPESQAALMNRLYRGTVSSAAVPLLNEQARDLYHYDDLDAVFAVSPLRGFPPLTDEGNGIATYLDWVKAWERVRFTAMSATGTTS